jgi:PAS domain S-box-containing protein
MFTIDDLFISLSVLICFRLSAFIVFFSRYFRDNKSRYGVISLGWLVYAVGPVFGLLEYINTGDSNHPIFGYSAAVGTFLLMFGILLYHFKVTLQWFVNLFLFFVIGFGLLLSFYPEMSGIFGVTAQLLLIVSTLIIVVFKRKWLMSISGKASYIWLCLFLLLSILHAFGFNFWYSEMPISLRFVMTFLTNLFLYIFLFDFDWEQSFRKLRVSEAKLKASLKEKEILLHDLEKGIAEHKQTEEELRKSEEKFRLLTELSPVGVFITDNKGLTIYWNKMLCKITGMSVVDGRGTGWADGIHPDDRERVFKEWYESEEKRSTFYSEYRFVNKEGVVTSTIGQAVPLKEVSGNNVNEYLGTITDVTELKKKEKQIKASLKEKETLLHEIHHRVKNNMTVISSLLKLQANSMEDERLKAALMDSQNRVQSMSAIHETLYQSENLSALDMNSYLTKLTRDVVQNYTLSAKVVFNIEADLVFIGTKQASPVGLIVNELITNSLKYAFPDDQKGEINISLQKNENQIELQYSDNGIGIPMDFDWRKTKSMGLNLVKILVENQLDGSIDMENNNGTKFIIKFNIET